MHERRETECEEGDCHTIELRAFRDAKHFAADEGCVRGEGFVNESMPEFTAVVLVMRTSVAEKKREGS